MNISLKTWYLATRPKTLWAGVCPVMIGVALAISDGVFQATAASLALCAAVSIQIATNFANDYYDGIKGTDTKNRLGPLRAVQAGLVTPKQMYCATWIAFAVFLVFAMMLCLIAGWPLFLLALVSVISGYAYTGGPYPLGYNGLGDIFAFLFFGPVAVAGTYFVQAQELTWIAVAAGIAPGLFSVAILTVNNLRDIKEDAQAGKRTLAVRLGVCFSRLEYLMSFVGIAVSTLCVVLVSGHSLYPMMATIVCVLAIPSIKDVCDTGVNGYVLNETLARTAKLLLIYSLLFSIAWML